MTVVIAMHDGYDGNDGAAAMISVGPTDVRAKGKLDVSGAKVPGLGNDSPTMPGIGENHTHRSQGSLSSRFVVDPVRSNDLRPTGMSTTEDASGVLDDFDCDGTPDNFDFDGLNFYFDLNTTSDGVREM